MHAVMMERGQLLMVTIRGLTAGQEIDWELREAMPPLIPTDRIPHWDMETEKWLREKEWNEAFIAAFGG